MNRLRNNLKKTVDVERMVTKINKKTASPRDLIGLA